MTDNQTPPYWVLIEAAKRSGWDNLPVAELHGYYCDDLCCHNGFRALCNMILKYEQPPVDRKMLCALEALREAYEAGECVAWTPEQEIVRAIELWEEGFGK